MPPQLQGSKPSLSLCSSLRTDFLRHPPLPGGLFLMTTGKYIIDHRYHQFFLSLFFGLVSFVSSFVGPCVNYRETMFTLLALLI